MKKSTIILGMSFVSLLFIASLFKTMHWPGANIGLLISCVGLAFVTVPMIAKYLIGKAN